MVAMLGKLSALFKLRIGIAITLCALAGMAMTQGNPLPVWKVTVLMLAVLLSSGAAGAFNQYIERDLDARMARTRARPFVTGEFHAGWIWLAVILAVLAVAVLAAAWVSNIAAAVYVFLGAFFYGVVYTMWLKRRTVWNIVVGGLAGSFAVLAGSAAIDPNLSPAAIILAVVLFLWTPPHFWSLATVLHKDYAAAGVPMLPVVVGDAAAAKIILGHTLVLVALSVVPVAFGMGVVYLAGALVGGGYFILKSVELARDPGPRAARANFMASFVQLGLLLVAAILDRVLMV